MKGNERIKGSRRKVKPFKARQGHLQEIANHMGKREGEPIEGVLARHDAMRYFAVPQNGRLRQSPFTRRTSVCLRPTFPSLEESGARKYSSSTPIRSR